MTLDQFLGRLQRVKGPGAGGEYMARCPCHDDSTQSLSVGAKVSPDGHTRILLCCHAGCRSEDVMAALGVKPRDLIVDPDPEWGKGKNGGLSDRPPDPLRGSPHKEGQGEAAEPEGGAGNRQVPERIGGLNVYQAGGKSSENGDANGAPARGSAGQDRAADGKNVEKGEQSEKKEKEKPKFDLNKPDVVYSYAGDDGREAFQVCRYYWTDENGKRKKDFRQRRHLPGDPKASRDGYVYSVPAELRDRTLYRLPELLAAIREGRTVYLVEGEKDVETLRRLGYTATCNPGGAGKWRDGYTERLKGADVIILPDNDPRSDKGQYAGQDHAWNAAMAIRETAKRVRLVNLKEACPELPEKGDISDMVQLMGDTKAMDALARQAAATRDFDPEDVPFWLTPIEQCQRLYHQVPGGYDAEKGCIVQHVGDAVKPLTDFVVIPKAELIRDDGVEKNLYFVLDGWAGGNGRKLERVTVSGSELDSMNWVSQKWGFAANILPGSTTKGKVAWAIKKVGQMTAKRVTEYSHTGWRRIGGEWAFLYQGGAVGAEGVTVNLGEKLSAYRLDGGGNPAFREIPLRDAIRRSLDILKAMDEKVSLPTLATMYLAPLREFMALTDVAPAFALFLYGETGTHKSTAAALCLSHFGNFHAKNPPASFRDTANATRMKAFHVKDMPLLVDDFYPTTSQQEKRTMASTAQNLSRAFGDGADRGRLQSDGSIQASRPPRSVAVMTGEVLPDIGASGLARFFIVNIERGDIPLTKDLTQLQEDARNGVLQRAMRGYIQWLARQADKMPERLHDLFLQFRDMARERAKGSGHDRAPEAVACILLGYQCMLNYMRDQEVITTQDAQEMLVHGLKVLTEISDNQSAAMEEEKPTQVFLDTIGEAISSGRAWAKDLQDPTEKAPPPAVRMIGYRDASYYYLIPRTVYGFVAQVCRESGTEFPLTRSALYKQLRADGIAEGMTKESITRPKYIDGKSERLLWIPRERISGKKDGGEQTKMDMSGAAPVETELPDNW